MAPFSSGSDVEEVEEEAEETVENTPMSTGDPVAVIAVGSALLSRHRFPVGGTGSAASSRGCGRPPS